VRTLVLAARSQAASGHVELALQILRSALELAPDDLEALGTLKALES
jgi:Flp pilus assembly protein TadD